MFFPISTEPDQTTGEMLPPGWYSKTKLSCRPAECVLTLFTNRAVSDIVMDDLCNSVPAPAARTGSVSIPAVMANEVNRARPLWIGLHFMDRPPV